MEKSEQFLLSPGLLGAASVVVVGRASVVVVVACVVVDTNVVTVGDGCDVVVTLPSLVVIVSSEVVVVPGPLVEVGLPPVWWSRWSSPSFLELACLNRRYLRPIKEGLYVASLSVRVPSQGA